jgi:SAM-dependent methyltransferase
MRSLLRQSDSVRALVHAGRAIPSDVRRLVGVAARGTRIRDYFARHRHRRLQIGAGPNELDGWLNADFSPRSASAIFMDATRPFPFPSTSFDVVFSEHMIEHVPFEQGLSMLRECHRVLKRGGTLRVATPNAEQIAALLTPHPSESQQRYVSWAIENHVPFALPLKDGDQPYRPAYVLNNFFWGFGHYFVYDPATLGAALASSGFTEIRFFPPGESDIDELRGLEKHAALIGEERNQFETMVVQAKKP